MFSRIGAMVRKEFIQIVRDKRTLALILVQPIMLLIIFGYGINTVVDHLSMAVYDEAGDADSRALLAAFENSGYFDIVTMALSQPELMAAIDAGDAKLALHIPPDFGGRMLRGETGVVQLIVDGSDPNVASTASFAAGAVAQAQSARIVSTQIARRSAAVAAGGIEMRSVVLYNPQMRSANFMVPSVIGLIMAFQTLLLTAFAVVREREQGTLEQIIVTPIRTWEFMLGKILPYTVTASFAAAGSLIAARLIFSVEVAGSMALLAALSIVFLIGSLGLGLFVSTVSQTGGQAIQIAMFIMLPSILLSGFLYPIESMPWIIQRLSALMPMTYFLKILRGIIIKGAGLPELWPAVWPLMLFGIVIFTLSALRFQKRVG